MPDSVRDIRQQPFIWIDRALFSNYGAQIGPNGIAVYGALVFRSDRDGRAFPGMTDIMNLTGIRSRNTIKKAVKTLEAANLIKIVTRFNGKKYESNVYYILTVGQKAPEKLSTGISADDTGVSADDTGVSADDTGVGHLLIQVYQEMTEGVSAGEQDQQSLNNNHDQQSLSKSSNNSSSEPLPAAAASLLEIFGIEQKVNGDAMSAAAWLAYAQTQPGLRNPVGYALTQTRKGNAPEPVYTEIAAIDLEWPKVLTFAPYEHMYRQNPGVQGIEGGLVEELETVSDQAIKTLARIAEARK